MPGKLAGLFQTRSNSQQASTTPQQPTAVSKPATVTDIREQLRAVSDAETVLTGEHARVSFCSSLAVCAFEGTNDMLFAGLRNLRKRLQDADAEEVCSSFLRQSSASEELSNIWESQMLVFVDSYSLLLFC